MSITPIYPRYQYDQQGKSKCPYEVSGSDIFGVLSLSALGTGAPITSVIVGYSSVHQDEIFYITSADKLFAVLANGLKAGTSIHPDSILWTFSGFLPLPYTSFGLVLSNDGETIYWNNNFYDYAGTSCQLFAINASDGTEKWMTEYKDFGNSLSFKTPIIEDKYGKIHIQYVAYTGSTTTWYFERYNPTTGTLEEQKFITSTSSTVRGGAHNIVTNNTKDVLFYGTHIRFSGVTGITEIYRVSLNPDGSYGALQSIPIQVDASTYINIQDLTYNSEGDDIIYVTTTSGLVKVNFSPESQSWYYDGIDPSSIRGGPALATDGTIYYRAGIRLYAINPDGTLKWSVSTLPAENSYSSPIIDANDNIIISSYNSDAVDNIHIFDKFGVLQSSFRSISIQKRIERNVSLGSSFGLINNILYLPVYDTVSAAGSVYLLKSADVPITTTTTTTALESESSESESTGTSSSTTSESDAPTTTTTTTPIATLSQVLTEVFPIQNDSILQDKSLSASDSPQTNGTSFAIAFNFGTIAPGETSKTIAVALNIPHASVIQNIKLALTDTGGIEFTDDIFGITTSSELRADIIPISYFKGINIDNSELNAYNVVIGNRNFSKSNYVYLNVQLPTDNFLGSGIIKFKWFFDYAN